MAIAADKSRSHMDGVKMGSERGFGLVFTAVFTIIRLWPTFTFRTLPALSLDSARLWALAIALACLLVALLAPAVLRPLNVLWFKFGMLLGRIMNPIVMGVLFFLVFVPFAIVLRLLGKDLLRLKLDRAAPSYWIRRTPPGPTGDSLRNQY
ncbi:MAG TPA: SxtJ family membrane protein [Hyphomicrobiaceae bacterium]|nr:SxtJ family membrane protein [Hyphomicrobiaceae bacterium]